MGPIKSSSVPFKPQYTVYILLTACLSELLNEGHRISRLKSDVRYSGEVPSLFYLMGLQSLYEIPPLPFSPVKAGASLFPTHGSSS